MCGKPANRRAWSQRTWTARSVVRDIEDPEVGDCVVEEVKHLLAQLGVLGFQPHTSGNPDSCANGQLAATHYTGRERAVPFERAGRYKIPLCSIILLKHPRPACRSA